MVEDPEPDPYLWLTDPDPDSPKTYGSCGSGSACGSGFATLLSGHVLLVFTILFLSRWKNQTQFQLGPWNYLLILKILPVSRFKEPEAAILRLKMLTGSRLWFCKIIPEGACDNERSALENIDQSQIREFWGGFQKAFSKTSPVSTFNEANKKLITV